MQIQNCPMEEILAPSLFYIKCQGKKVKFNRKENFSGEMVFNATFDRWFFHIPRRCNVVVHVLIGPIIFKAKKKTETSEKGFFEEKILQLPFFQHRVR